ncbi:hypothetical protein F8C76_00160 [Flagellimonas olearia]|uniref:Uncharacterized protein n=1 Tax=Flagellimonas olearia TaxID=552546 RepID=A0A6I1DYT3_9FLAO|nr:hypothetical protein [Allomuricauda olearia]KAB7529977.1 hypothetical protein F8C76_00160 [Allomuricauda olearia]
MVIALTFGLVVSWYFDIWHSPVETIDELIGKNYDFAARNYFKSPPQYQYEVNVNHELSEFDGAILHHKEKLKDSIVQVYTWKFINRKKTIWVGKTSESDSQIIDAIRYKNDIKF